MASKALFFFAVLVLASSREACLTLDAIVMSCPFKSYMMCSVFLVSYKMGSYFFAGKYVEENSRIGSACN